MGRAFGARWLLACALALPATVLPAAALVGSPPTTRFVPDLDVFPQNFAIAQDSRGIVYVGNTNGVLEFDGERWALIPLANREIVRSLAVGGDDRVYVGGYNALGYLQRDPTGSAHFVDLTPRFAAQVNGEFADIWDTLVAPEGVYFRALRDLFFWDPSSDTVRHWHHDGRFGAIVHHRGETILQFRGAGLKRRNGDEWNLLPGTESLVDLIGNLVPLADGGLLTVGVDGAWWRWADGGLAAAQMPVGFPPASTFNEAIALADGSLAFNGNDGVVSIVASDRHSELHFKLDPGFLSGLSVAQDGGFLVSGNQAIYRVAWPTPWSVLGAEHQIDGSLEQLAEWNGEDYLLTTAGAFRVVPATGSTPRFVHMPWGDSIAYDLLGIDVGRAVLATSHKLMLVQHGAVRELSPELVYPRLLQASKFRRGRIYIGTEQGLRMLDDIGGKLILSEPASSTQTARVTGLVEISAQELWFGTERHGLWRVRLDDLGAIAEQRRYDNTEGLRLGVVPEASVARMADGQLIVTTSQGIFRRDGDNFVDESLAGLDRARAMEELLHLVQVDNGEQWAYGISRLLHRPAGGSWSEQPVRQLRRGNYVRHRLHTDGRTTFIASQSLLMHDGNLETLRAQPPQVQLRAVALLPGNGTRRPLPLVNIEPQRLAYGDFALQFQFALPDLSQERGRQYQGRLAGYETAYSDWGNVRGYTYSRLSPGRYSLEVRARDSAGVVSHLPAYDFVIESPWYLRWWAYGLWVLLAAGLLGCAVQYAIARRTRRLADDKLHLEATVATRTRDLATANQRLEMMAHLDGLTGIANRRRLDEYLAAVWAQGRERGRPLALLAIDVDHFKVYNDTHGHLAGDQLLKDIVECLANCLRRSEDLLARYGGEEFLVAMPGADAATGAAVAESMRAAVETAQLGASVSIGVASWIPMTDSVAGLIDAADRALYAAKHAGRNRVVVSAAHGPP